MLPDAVERRADQRPVADVQGRWRYFDDLVFEALDAQPDRLGHRGAEQAQGADQARQADNHQNSRRPAGAVAKDAGQTLVQGVEGDGQDYRPEHQAQEWLEDLEAEHHQYRNQSCSDQNIQQFSAVSKLYRALLSHGSFLVRRC
ncbi:hypothetical protein D3C77_596200 [compost metagenome]